MHRNEDILENQAIKQSARAILFDNADNLILFKRTKLGQPVYWATPGGHVDETDRSLEATLQRELTEELNARVSDIARVFIYSRISAENLIIEHFFVARLVAIDESAPRTGPEFQSPKINSTYEIDKVNLLQTELESINLQPKPLKQFILANQVALIALARDLDMT